MNLYLRLLWVILLSFFQRRTDVLDEVSLGFITLPNDLDLNGHMNNGRYLSLMDLGRINLTVRCGLLPPIAKNRWFPVLGSARIRFKRSLHPFERYALKTRIIGWDEKWFFIEQRFESGGRVCAIAVVKGLFRSPQGNVATARIFQAIGKNLSSPVLSDEIAAWAKADV